MTQRASITHISEHRGRSKETATPNLGQGGFGLSSGEWSKSIEVQDSCETIVADRRESKADF